jgi:hypothetical protein
VTVWIDPNQRSSTSGCPSGKIKLVDQGKERIEQALRRGLLRKSAAEKFLRILDRLERHPIPPGKIRRWLWFFNFKNPRVGDIARVRYLTGQIDLGEYLWQVLVNTVTSAIEYSIVMFLFLLTALLVQRSPKSTVETLLIAAACAGGVGLFFGTGIFAIWRFEAWRAAKVVRFLETSTQAGEKA